MAASAQKRSSARAGWVVAALLLVALAGSWVWFLRGPSGAAQLSQEQLDALAAQAGRSDPKRGRGADPYEVQAVKAAIREHALEIQKPWLAYLASGPAQTAGAVTLSWTIAADGKPAQVAVVHSDFKQQAFNNGVLAAVAALVFPPPPGGQAVSVTHKLFFKQEPGVS